MTFGQNNPKLNSRLVYCSRFYGMFFSLTDTKPPVINCTEDMVVSTEPGLYYATLNLTMPVGHGKRAEQCFLFFLLIHTILRKHKGGFKNGHLCFLTEKKSFLHSGWVRKCSKTCFRNTYMNGP